MNTNNTAIIYEDIRKEIFTKKQLVQLDKKLKAKIVLRKLKQERIKQGYTQQQLSEKVNLPRTTISKIENGTQNITIEKIIQYVSGLQGEIEITFIKRSH